MKPPIFRYNRDQLKAISIIEKAPITFAELHAYFPELTTKELNFVLRTPTEREKIIKTSSGKYETYKLPSNVKVTYVSPQPYSAPPKKENILWDSDICQ